MTVAGDDARSPPPPSSTKPTMPIGPSLPPHLQRQQQQHDSDDEDDQDFGPAPPPAISSASVGPSRPATSSIGPSLPPHLQARQTSPSGEGPQQEQEEDEEDTSIGPALPPHLLAARQAKGEAPAAVPSLGPQRPTVGPSRPPGWEPASPSRYDDDESSDDDVVGPMPLPEGVTFDEQASAVWEFQERQKRWEKEREVNLFPTLAKGVSTDSA